MRKKFLWSLIASCLFIGTAMAQDITVKGKVTDEKGEPIAGASVQVKGSKAGTTANATGEFTLKAANGATLVVSALSFESKQVAAAANLVVKLATDTKAMSEVVVTGVGTATSKRKLGIAVESISADKLPAAPSASIDQALVGKIAGAQISSISGNPGDPVNIVLRGINTVQGGTKPLIMLDGVEVRSTDLNSLDLSNIERVEVVQGAASASLYGAQGANGVIQLFSKKGKKGATAINYSSGYAQNEFINSGNFNKSKLHPYLTDASNNIIDYRTGKPLAYDEFGYLYPLSYTYGGSARYGILDPRNTNSKPYNANIKWYDHFDQIFQKGYTLNNSISFSGASDKSDYSFSAANSHTLTAVMKNGYHDRSNITANIGTELFKGFKFRSITQLIYTKNTMHPGLGGAGGYGYGRGNSLGTNGQVYSFLNTSPFFDLTAKNADGTRPADQYAGFLSVNGYNPYYQMEYSQSQDDKIDVVQNFEASYKVNKFIDLKANYGLNWRNERTRYIFPNQTTNPNSNDSYVWASWFNGNDNTGEIANFQYENLFKNFLASAYIKTDFEKDFGWKLPIQTNTQISFDHRQNRYREYDTYGLSLPLDPPINLNSTQSQYVAWDYVEPFVTYGYLINQKFDYSNFAGITVGVRSDYSSTFGKGSKPFTFPHFDGYLLPSSMDFWKGKLADVVPFFKLRAAYGQAGIQPGAFDRYPVLNQQNLGDNIVYSKKIPSNNPNLQVEVSNEFEVGTDFTINTATNSNWLKNINGSATYWKRSSSNVIFAVAVPLSTGSTNTLTNAIDMSSHGFQFSLNMPIYSSKVFNWDLTTNFGKQISMIDKIAGGAEIPLTSGAGSTVEVLIAGKPIGQIFAYKTLRTLQDTRKDGTRYIPAANEGLYTIVHDPYAGDVVVQKDTKGMMMTGETYAIGDPNPKFNMSFINSMGYKDIVNLSFQFDWVHGSHLYNQTKEWMYRDGISSDFDTPVTIDGATAAWTAYHASAYYALWGSKSGAGNNATKDYFYEDASFVRLRNVALSVDLAKFKTFKGFKKLQLVLSGRNLLTFTKYTGMDPEISSGAVNSSFDRGIDHSTMPNIKSYQVGLNVGF